MRVILNITPFVIPVLTWLHGYNKGYKHGAQEHGRNLS